MRGGGRWGGERDTAEGGVGWGEGVTGVRVDHVEKFGVGELLLRLGHRSLEQLVHNLFAAGAGNQRFALNSKCRWARISRAEAQDTPPSAPINVYRAPMGLTQGAIHFFGERYAGTLGRWFAQKEGATQARG